MQYIPNAYGPTCTDHLLNHTNAGLFLEPGLGKTVITLTAYAELLSSQRVKKVLIIGPKRVIENTWTDERDKWDHLQHLRMVKVLGTEKQRKKALSTASDFYLINRENVVWLQSYYSSAWPFDAVIIDELSSFKSARSARFKAMKMTLPFIKRMNGLTGTPMPNGLLDLWPQIYLLDRGERLGETQHAFQQKYFTAYVKRGVPGDQFAIKKGEELLGSDIYEKLIYEKISDICISMRAKDWLQLPERIDINKKIRLSAHTEALYREFERKKILEMLQEDEDAANGKITAVNAAVLTGKLLQFANGAVYDSKREWYEVHNEKIEALGETLESMQGRPILVLYSFRHDVDRIMKHLRSFKPEIFTPDTLVRWNRGEIPFLLGHPASMGHGLNMQDGGHHMEHFGHTWGSELTLQVIARLDRQGQKNSVINSRLIVAGTMDERVIESQDEKISNQNSMMEAVKALVQKYR